MEGVSEEIGRVEVTEDFHICPSCGYQRGFHLSFIARQGTDSSSLILVCPDCGARLDIGKTMSAFGRPFRTPRGSPRRHALTRR